MNKFFFFVIALLIAFLSKAWFITPTISGGDFPYYFSINSQTILYPFAWLGLQNLGIYNIAFIVNLFPVSPVVFFLSNIFHLSWSSIGKFVYFYPTILLSFFSSYYLYKTVSFDKRFVSLAVGIFLLNTYLLMILGGGQMLLALALSITPAILGFIFTLSPKISLQKILRLGLLYAVAIGLDLRITYILFISIFLYWVIKSVLKQSLKYLLHSLTTFLIFPLAVTSMLHMFWILPTVMVHQNPFQQLGSAYSSVEAVKYFSFEKFEDALGLLHPNWPENIFGKVGFMKPEFLLLPILAFSSLLFINKKAKSDEEKKEKLYVIYFALLGLVGIFLAKGANDPFGGIYLWMFGHIPGFVMFRDPTKWYLLIALSYSMLIPYTVSKIYDLLKRRFA